MRRTTNIRTLGLHQITVMEADPIALIEIARGAGYGEVCVFTHIPAIGSTEANGKKPHFPLVTEANKQDVLAALDNRGIRVANAEFFSIFEGVDIESFRPGLELACELRARCVVTHVLDPDQLRAEDSLARLAELAAEYSLDVGLEFMGVSPACNSIAKAVHYARTINSSHFGIAVDMLHMMRTGTSVADLKPVPSELIKYAQVCDGATLDLSADYMDEALNGRLIPGAGCFPIADILKALPKNVPLDIEVPNLTRQGRGITGLRFAREAFSATQNLLMDL